ncbi:hypothetical protein PABG_05830 [Paracoccidioides brasiliensis Pb03]|nr:hypothetical protein PABG_05830 [Paracoccidioides brasiliensis Pb03]
MGTVESARDWSDHRVSSPLANPHQSSGQDVESIREPRDNYHIGNASRELLPSIAHLDLENSGRSVGRASADTRRPGEEKDQRPHNQPLYIPQRQSLPSIHEALGSAPFGLPSASSSAKPGTLPTSISPSIARPALDGPSGPSNPFSSGPGSFLRDNPFAAHQTLQRGQTQTEASPSSLASIHSHESRNPSILSLSSGKSPTQSSKDGAPSLSNSQSSVYELVGASSAGPMSSPTNYTTPYPPTAPYGSQFLNGSSSLPYSSGSYDMRASWKQHAIDPARMEDVQSTRSSAGPGSHLDSGKRHLEGYDVEVVFNEIIERSSAAIEFARHFSAKAHQNNRSVPAAGSMPQLSEIDELAQIIRKSAEALDKIRCYVVEQTLAEQQAEQRAQTTVYQRRGPYNDDQAAVYREDFKGGGGGFAGGDSKKRRGKAAPPGRCHSCNRAETPEWRRGPDGARTLCNACGLHYAKLTRKLAGSKPSSLGSNLRPKSGADPRSPTEL